jgi:uncharacterized protein YuzE
MTFDEETEHAYICLTEPQMGIAKTTVALSPSAGEPEAMRSLALDFDSDGRLVGIEVLGPASAALRADVLLEAVRLSDPAAE